MARDVIDAIQSVVPLRQCTVRMGRNYRSPEDAPVCSAAQLGVAYCPCSGTADPAVYAEAVSAVVRIMSGDAQDVIEKLTAKMRKHSQAQRFEEAGDVLSRIDALETVLWRMQTARELVDAGSFSFAPGARLGDGARLSDGAIAGAAAISYQIDCGRLRATHVDGVIFSPQLPPVKIDFDELLSPPTLGAATLPVNADVIDEILCIARHTRAASTVEDPASAA